jgi:hypothetical protein
LKVRLVNQTAPDITKEECPEIARNLGVNISSITRATEGIEGTTE